MKKPLPALSWQTVSEMQKSRLARWLSTWKVEQREHPWTPSDSDLTPPTAVPPRRSSKLVSSYDRWPILPGEIRLLSSRFFPPSSRPIYVAVLSVWEADLMLVAPFAPLIVAATPGEIEMGREGALAVLCLWNARSTPRNLLAQSWLVDRLGEEELSDAWAVFRHTMTGVELPTELSERIGPPVFVDDNPRLVYQQHEAALLAPLSDAAEESLEGKIIYLPEVFAHLEKVRRVAGAPGIMPAQSFTDPVRSLTVRTKLDASMETVTLIVEDAAGQPSALLDHAWAIARNGDRLVRIERCVARLPATALREGFSLESSAGARIDLR